MRRLSLLTSVRVIGPGVCRSCDEPLALMNIEFDQTFISHFKTSSFCTLARFINFQRLLTKCIQDRRRSFNMIPPTDIHNLCQIITSLIRPSSIVPAESASRANFSMIGRFATRYCCACTFVGSLVSTMQLSCEFPSAI